MHRRRNSRNEERSPLKRLVVIVGLSCGERSESTSIVRVSGRGSGGRQLHRDLMDTLRNPVDGQRFESTDDVRGGLDEWIVGKQVVIR